MTRHGVAGYTRGCRCEICRAAWSAYHREYRQRRAENDGASLRRSSIPDPPSSDLGEETSTSTSERPISPDVGEGLPIGSKRFARFRRSNLVRYLSVVLVFALLAWLFAQGWWVAAVALIVGLLVAITVALRRRFPPKPKPRKQERPFRYEAGIRPQLAAGRVGASKGRVEWSLLLLHDRNGSVRSRPCGSRFTGRQLDDVELRCGLRAMQPLEGRQDGLGVRPDSND
jgi:hypothetical protein